MSSQNFYVPHGVGEGDTARCGSSSSSDKAASGRDRGPGKAVLDKPVEMPLTDREIQESRTSATFNPIHPNSDRHSDLYVSSFSCFTSQQQPAHIGDAGITRSRSVSTALYTSGGGRDACRNAAAKDLEGDALVAAALQHIQKYESRKVVRTEHSRRLDTDIS